MVNYLTLQLNFIASLFYVRRILAFSVTLHFAEFHFAGGSYPDLRERWVHCRSSHGTDSLIFAHLSGRRPRFLLALPSGSLSGPGCSAKLSDASPHQTSPSASCCPAGELAALSAEALPRCHTAGDSTVMRQRPGG